MGQKVNPHGLRVGVIKDWDSRWYARNDKVGDLIVEDYNIRKDLKKRLYGAGIAKIEIERSNGRVKINVYAAAGLIGFMALNLTLSFCAQGIFGALLDGLTRFA